MEAKLRYIGRDVHKETISTAVAEAEGAKAEQFAKVPSEWAVLQVGAQRVGRSPAAWKSTVVAATWLK